MTMDFNERVIPGVSSNFMFREALARYEFALKFLKPKDKVLDLGCGTGYGSDVLAKKAGEVLGIDIDKEAIDFAGKNYRRKNLVFKLSDLNDFNSSTIFDVICSFEVIEHLKNPNKYLAQVKRFLKPGGILVLSTPNIAFTASEKNFSPYHEKEYNLKEFSGLLKKNFGKVDIYGQTKSKKALRAWVDFLSSQVARQSVIDSDKLGLRKLIPRGLKEKVWKIIGNFAGRKTQEKLSTKDFPISLKSVRLAHYFVAVCRKSR